MFELPPELEKEVALLSPGPGGFRWRARLFISLLLALGWTVRITDGRRTAAEQNRLHLLNPSNPAATAANPGKHLTGDALDVNLFRKGSGWLRMATPRAAWVASGVPFLAGLCLIAWGGNFQTYGPNGDPVHFYKA